MHKCGLKTLSTVVLSCLVVSAIGGCSKTDTPANVEVPVLTDEMREELGFNADPVTTSDIVVTTDDASIFADDANIVSSYGNAYVLSYDSVEEAATARDGYVEQGAIVADFSGVATVAEDTPTDVSIDYTDSIAILDSIEIPEDVDFSNYVALIDTGADTEYAFSVVGDDTSDTFGHGSIMLDRMVNVNADIQVVSIKVAEDGVASAASVYAGFALAEELGVSAINFSMVAPDIEKNAIVKIAIQDAIDSGITVIGAAGNYDVSALDFIPGSIDAVYTIGAAEWDATKRVSSNYDADYYVVANSTSEATAIFTAYYTLNDIAHEGMIFQTVVYDEVNESTITVTEDGFVTAIGVDPSAASTAYIQYDKDAHPAPASGTYYGRCTVSLGGPASGGYVGSSASGFNSIDIPGHSGNSAAFANWANGLGGPLPIVCAAVFDGGEKSGGDSYATWRSGSTANYKAIVSSDGHVTVYYTSTSQDPDTTTSGNGQDATVTIRWSMSQGIWVFSVIDSVYGSQGTFTGSLASARSQAFAAYKKLSGKTSWGVPDLDITPNGSWSGPYTDYPLGQKLRGDAGPGPGGVTPEPHDADNYTYHAAAGKRILTSELNDLIAAYGQSYVYNNMTFEARVNQDCIIVTSAGADGVYGLGAGADGVYGPQYYYAADGTTRVGPDGRANTSDDNDTYTDDVNDDSYYSVGAGTAIWSGNLSGMTPHTDGSYTIFQSPTFPTDGVFAVMASDNSYSAATITVTLTETGAIDAGYPG